FICSELNASALRELSEFYADKQRGGLACGLESKIESEKVDSSVESTTQNNTQRHKKLRLGFSSSSTCEIGLNDKTNIIWQNLLYLVDSVSAKSKK
ncbi:hypothetical protein, partial [Helicobacter canis]|uniref:hypothetical protein n=1 Tax=Helicobacter canis TaxID=29419 RepID=UPI0026EE9E36